MERNAPGVRPRWLTLTADQHFNYKMNCCSLCWESPAWGDQIVTTKGTNHVCRQCAEGIAELVQSTARRRCSRHQCSKTFTGRGHYCSNACRQAAYRDRRQ